MPDEIPEPCRELLQWLESRNSRAACVTEVPDTGDPLVYCANKRWVDLGSTLWAWDRQDGLTQLISHGVPWYGLPAGAWFHLLTAEDRSTLFVRLSMSGSAVLVAWRLRRQGDDVRRKKRKPGRPRKSKPDKVDLVVARIIKKGEADVYRPDWKALRARYDDELPKSTSPEALRSRLRRTRQSRAMNEAVKK